MLNFWVFFRCLFCLMCAVTASGKVVLIGNNVTLSVQDIEANFAPSVKGSGMYGTLYVAEPLDACSLLTNKDVTKMNGTRYPFALIIRGVCSFDEKVRRAQAAGFKAAIVYDNEDGDLVAMAGNSAGVKINAVFVSKASGETLAKYAGAVDTEIWISPVYENSAWSIMAISFIPLLAMSAVLATCFFIRRHRITRERPQDPRVREFHGMSRRLVKAMPSLTFTAVLEDNCTSSTCAICLEDYNIGEKLRILPCGHKFHAICVDAWLTSWRTFCPVCKRDARTSTGEPPALESTPLLSSSPASSVLSSFRSSLASSRAMQIGQSSLQSPSISRPQSISTTPYNPYYHQSPNFSTSPASSVLSSFRSSLASSRAMQIGQSSLQSPSISRPQSISTTPYNPYYHQSPNFSTSRTSVDIRNMSSQRSLGGYLISPHSLGYPSISPLNSRYMSPYIPSPSNASSSYIGSSSRPPNQLHYSESAASFSPFASAQSLPGC